MLIQFTVENFLSFKDKAYLSLEPSKDHEHPENLITRGEYTSVSSIAVYGANASGKTSLFQAVTRALILIRNSNNVQVTDRLPITPFKFAAETQSKPSSFEFTFIASDKKKYIYGFSATSEKVTEEYLYIYNSAKPTLIFDLQEGEIPKYNRTYKTRLEVAFRMNTLNKLFLATATAWNVECTKIPFEWLTNSIDTFTEVTNMGVMAFEKYRTDAEKKYIHFTRELLKQADINISRIEVDAKEMPAGVVPAVQVMFQGNEVLPQNEGKHYEVEITTGHVVSDENGKNKEYSLKLWEESMGTQLLFFYGPLLKDAFEKGKTLMIDEIDKSLHPSLLKYIMNLFRDPDTNRMGAQLIVTTHETGILTLDMFRRDQIYFTEKDNKTGSTDLYSLDEFSVRKTENIGKGYLMGRYGAIPFLQNEEAL